MPAAVRSEPEETSGAPLLPCVSVHSCGAGRADLGQGCGSGADDSCAASPMSLYAGALLRLALLDTGAV